MYKQHQVILVATDSTTKKGDLCLGNTGKVLMVSLTDNHPYKQQHLYILSEEKIEIGDWHYDSSDNSIKQWKGNLQSNRLTSKKIIASTDKSLTKYLGTDGNGFHESRYLSQIHQLFIQYFITEFNKGNVIDKVNVEYEENCNCHPMCKHPFIEGNCRQRNRGVLQLKLNQDNTINIKPIKESWNREEMEEIHVSIVKQGCLFEGGSWSDEHERLVREQFHKYANQNL